MNKYRVTLITGNTVDVEADSALVSYSGQGAAGSSLLFYKNGDLVERNVRHNLLGELNFDAEPQYNAPRFNQINIASFNLGSWIYFKQLEDDLEKEQVKAA